MATIHQFPPRGTGQDRRPVIILDGVTYTRHGRKPDDVQVIARIDAKRIAREAMLTLFELLGWTMILGSIAVCIVAYLG